MSELLRLEKDELGRAFLHEVEVFVRLRSVARRYHDEVCGCEGDGCELGEELERTGHLDPWPQRKSAHERKAA